MLLVEQTRIERAGATSPDRKSALGQYFTPAATARFMAGMFEPVSTPAALLLDAGAGIGSLSAAFVERAAAMGLKSVQVQAFEIDARVHADLQQTLSQSSAGCDLAFSISDTDFIEHAVNQIQFHGASRFTHAILNPPYKKISNDSRHRRLLHEVGLQTVNLYSAFTALALELLQPGGQLVAIVPRSFCNGPYYRPFRQWLLARAALQRIHLFGSRESAFKGDGVLQENVIVMLQRGAEQREVVISHSSDDTFADLSVEAHRFCAVVAVDDAERVIHVPAVACAGVPAGQSAPVLTAALPDLDIQVSTGPVVDFRVAEHLRMLPGPGTVPLLYPGHFGPAGLRWPRDDFKKPNAIAANTDTRKWLYASGNYCVVRRLSSKEEARRIVAGVISANDFPDAAELGFENHLNVFHRHKQGLPGTMAAGLAAFLTSSAVDTAFRRFNGHTQVNASDLRRLRYPDSATLLRLGQWALALRHPPSTAEVDAQMAASTP